jgi:hypothetical protein
MPPWIDMWTMRRRIVKAAWTAALVSLAPASSARAGEYHVYSCRTPSGASAPVDGWSGAKTGAYDRAEDTCGQAGGALVAALGYQTKHPVNVDPATWTFSTPANDTMTAATLWRAGDADGGAITNATYEFWLAGPSDNSIFDDCVYQSKCSSGVGDPGQPMSGANRVVVPGANLGSHLYLNAACGGISEFECQSEVGDANHYAAVVYLYAADMTLEQSAGPTASNVSGELASAPAVSGTSDVAFAASDPGAGVWEAVFSVDGKVVQSTVPDEDGGRCKNVGQTTDGLPAFLYLHPCPPSESVDVPFNTTAVSNGPHHLIVSVLDAAGNSAPVLDREIDVNNPIPAHPGPPNGTNASSQAVLTARWVSTTKAHLTSRWGKAETITGRLTAPGGVPIGGAQVDATATPDYTGAKASAITSPKTAPDGRFELRLPRGESSRRLTFAYRAHIGDALPVATRTLTLGVRAGMTLSVAPRTASVGGSIFFKGALKGTPQPAGGKQLVLEARSPGGEWIEFDVIRAGRHGRYRASYRFKFPGPARYQFRVVCKHEADFPFTEGASNLVRVRER